jgi:hypothetical protein
MYCEKIITYYGNQFILNLIALTIIFSLIYYQVNIFIYFILLSKFVKISFFAMLKLFIEYIYSISNGCFI